MSKDPIEEAGGINLYCAVGNDAVNGWDSLGFDREPNALEKVASPLLQSLAKKYALERATGNDAAAVETARTIYMMLVAGARTQGLTVAPRFLDKWMSKTGGTGALAADELKRLFSLEDIRNGLAIQAEALAKSGQTFKGQLLQKLQTTDKDFYHALGQFSVKFSGCVTSDNGDATKITLEGEFEIVDTYDWKNNDKKAVEFFSDLPPHYRVVIEDDMGDFVETHGGAKPFKPLGTYKGSVTGKVFAKPTIKRSFW